jgi:hypothetical protein
VNKFSKKIQLGLGSLLIAGALAAGMPLAAEAQGCGDYNGDGMVTIVDLMTAVRQFGQPKADGTPFTVHDIVVAVQTYGTAC